MIGISLFYMPGTIIGAFVVDYWGPKWTQISGLIAQVIVGFIMSGAYKQYVPSLHRFLYGRLMSTTRSLVGVPAAFTVVYGIFLSLGEFSTGNCLGLLAAKTGPTAVRGQFYGVAAATGKVGAFVGTWGTFDKTRSIS